MTYTITRENGVSDAMAVQEAINLCAANGDGQSVLAELLRDLRDSIEREIPTVDEPTEFGSVVQARMSEAPAHSDPMVWIYTPWHGEHYWRSGHGVSALWSELRDVEVLRVGVGDEERSDSAVRNLLNEIHYLIQAWESIPAQRVHDLITAYEIDAAAEAGSR